MQRPLFTLLACAVTFGPPLVAQEPPPAAILDVVEQKRAAVVHVYVRVEKKGAQHGKGWFKKESGRRSGAIVDAAGFVLTHWSCVEEAFVPGTDTPRHGHSIRVQLLDGTTHVAKLVANRSVEDLALIRFEPPAGTKLERFELANSAAMRPGGPVAVVGFPDGESMFVFAGVASRASGAVRIGTGKLEPSQLVLTDASIRPENNGGPMIDCEGRLLAICNSRYFVKPKAEPTAEDLAKPNFGVGVAADVIRDALRSGFKDVSITNRTLTRAPNGARSTSLDSAVQRVAKAIVSVHIGKDRPDLSTTDPYARTRRAGQGSGVLIDSTGLVLTNAHIVAKGDAFVTLADGKTYEAEVLAKKSSLNVALLRIRKTKKFPFVELGSSKSLIKGETILAVGNPRGTALSVGVGVVSETRRNARVGGDWSETSGLIQIDAPVNMGNSGGAVVTLDGRVVAIVNAGDSEEYVPDGEQKKETNIGFAVPIDKIRRSFGSDMDEHAGSNATVEAAATATEEQLRQRETAITELAEAKAGSLVSVYVAQKIETTDTFDPFADEKAVVIPRGQGSGVIIASSGLALTNEHVIRGANEVSVRTGTGQKFDAKVLSKSRVDDLALLQLELPEGTTLDYIELGDSDKLAIGSTVVAIGNPYGHANTVTSGVISAKNQAISIKGRGREFEGLLQTDAAINPGNSGGAMLDLSGKLVGINSAGSNADAEAGYAIPVNYVREKFNDKLLSTEKLKSVYLGLKVVDEDGKCVVSSVARHGPASRAGFEIGDVVTKVAAAAVGNRVDFRMSTLSASANRGLPIELQRDGKTMTLELTPLSAAVWRIYRQTGIECESVAFGKAPDLIRRAAVAMYQHYTGNQDAEPPMIAGHAVRVVRVGRSQLEDGLDLAPGDLLMGLEWARRLVGGGTNTSLEEFHTIAEIGAVFDKVATKEELPWKCYVYRDGKIHAADVAVKKVYD